MVERPARGYFGGLWVFPGGGLENVDSSPLAAEAVGGGHSDHAWRAAALRETAEEVGLALTTPPRSQPLVAEGAEVFEAVLEDGSRLDGEALRFLSRWITPRFAPRRYDARFYLATVDYDPDLVLRPSEVLDAAWVEPGEALQRGEDGAWSLVLPTIHHLRWLHRHGDVAAAWDAAGRATGEAVEPIIESDGSEVFLVVPEAAELP